VGIPMKEGLGAYCHQNKTELCNSSKYYFHI
jgi:hypothetical protein